MFEMFIPPISYIVLQYNPLDQYVLFPSPTLQDLDELIEVSTAQDVEVKDDEAGGTKELRHGSWPGKVQQRRSLVTWAIN